MLPAEFKQHIKTLRDNITSIIRGKDEVVNLCIVALLARGHVLFEDVPGVGKTTLASTIAMSIHCSFQRIQFTSDMLPSDILGVTIYDQARREFEFREGPLFANVVLADEINRTTPKTQSALLEAMNVGRVSMDRHVHELPKPFIVLATQNPVEFHGTFPLPKSQMDRFLMKVLVDYPDAQSEVGVLQLVRKEEAAKAALAHADKAATPESADGEAADERPSRDDTKKKPEKSVQTVSQESLFDARREIDAVHVAPAIETYIIDLLNATRHPDKYGDSLKKWIQIGSSPRGGIGIERTSRANAWLEGRDHVTPDDVRAVVHAVLRHRLILSYDANADGVTADQVIDELVKVVAVPA